METCNETKILFTSIENLICWIQLETNRSIEKKNWREEQ